jgi:hypothetical protein
MLKNIFIDKVGDQMVRCEDDTATFSFLNVSLTQTTDVVFDTGAIHFYGDCAISGSGTKFLYASTRTSTIHANSRLTFDYGITLSYDTDTSQRIWLEEKSSRLKFYDSTLYSVDDIRFTKGTLVFDSAVTFTIEVGKFCYLGNGVQADNIDLDYTLGSEFGMYGQLVNQNA